MRALTAAVRPAVATVMKPSFSAIPGPFFSGAFSSRQENLFSRPGASSASKTTRLRHSTLRLLSSFSACVGRARPRA